MLSAWSPAIRYLGWQSRRARKAVPIVNAAISIEPEAILALGVSCAAGAVKNAVGLIASAIPVPGLAESSSAANPYTLHPINGATAAEAVLWDMSCLMASYVFDPPPPIHDDFDDYIFLDPLDDKIFVDPEPRPTAADSELPLGDDDDELFIAPESEPITAHPTLADHESDAKKSTKVETKTTPATADSEVQMDAEREADEKADFKALAERLVNRAFSKNRFRALRSVLRIRGFEGNSDVINNFKEDTAVLPVSKPKPLRLNICVRGGSVNAHCGTTGARVKLSKRWRLTTIVPSEAIVSIRIRKADRILRMSSIGFSVPDWNFSWYLAHLLNLLLALKRSSKPNVKLSPTRKFKPLNDC
ncbi:hypothetical protein HDU97_006141 [Phlyctochytrium planicorne]|nr:hypothetical protein HDU97_006141 [Phlyctochytrium planicorne]